MGALYRKGIVPLVPMFILFLAIFLVVIMVLPNFFPKPPSAAIEIHNFDIDPPDFKTDESAELILEIENLVTDKSTTIFVYFETHGNVEIYMGNLLLPRTNANYTYSKSLDPKEKISLTFTVKADLEVGDAYRSYYIKAHIYVNGSFFEMREITFTVRRG